MVVFVRAALFLSVLLCGCPTARPIVHALHVQVEGSGSVSSSDGVVCIDDCRWTTNVPVRLVATASVGFTFVGFSGACEGTRCVVDGGLVKAVFAAIPVIRVVMSGTGAGTVAVGSTTCTTDCSVETDGGVRLTATPDDHTLAPTLSGDCDASPCFVTPPAIVNVAFERGRQVVVMRPGSGTGSVTVNDGAPCTRGTCRSVWPSTEPLAIQASEAPDDYTFFRGLDGGGCSRSRCDVDAGLDDVVVEARYDAALVWSRPFDALGQTLLADSQGIVVAGLAKEHVIVDQRTWVVTPLADLNLQLFVAVDWDAGTQWVLPFTSHKEQDGVQSGHYTNISRTDGGGAFVVGSCRRGRLNGLADCSGTTTPVWAVISSTGQLTSLETDLSSAYQANHEFAELHEFGGRTIALRTEDSSFVELGPFAGVDGGIEVAVRLPSARVVAGTQACDSSGPTLKCTFATYAALHLDDCVLDAGQFDGTTLLEFDQNLRCRWAQRLVGASATSGLSRSDDGGTLIAGFSTGTDFGNGLSIQPSSTWVAAWGSSGVERLSASPATSFYWGGPLHVERVGNEALVETMIADFPNHSQVLYGRTYFAQALALTFLTTGASLSPVREWVFTQTTLPNTPALEATRFTLVGDKLVLLVTGTDVKLGDLELSKDGKRRMHLIVLQAR